jgi:transcription elongation GreA/GreB family factor
MSAPESSEIVVGDTVQVRYLTGDQRTLVVTLSDKQNDPNNGFIHVHQPLGEALLGAELDQLVDVLVDSRLRPVKVEEVHKHQTA